MKKRTVLLLTPLLTCAFVSGAIWHNTNSFAQSKVSVDMEQEGLSKNPFYVLNEKAKAVNGGDQNSISELADDIISQFGLLDVLSGAKEAVKKRLVRAEINFQKGEKRGIPEENIVLMVNELADRLLAPDYAKTDLQQVRHIRVSRMQYLPNLINQQDADKKGASQKKIGSSINPNMSPLEAAYVAMDLIYQKTFTEDFQVTPQEFRDNLNKKRLEMWQAHQAEKAQSNSRQTADSVSEPVYELQAAESNLNRDKMRLTSDRASTMRRADLLNLLNSSLDTLGIER